MNQLKKGLFLSILLAVSLTASGFMVLEAGHFYQSLYVQSSFSLMGYWAAGLNEAFMAIMAGVWLPGRSKTKGHPVNLLFRFLLVLLFLTTVGGACFNGIQGQLQKIKTQQNQQEILQVLRSQVADHERSLKTFVDQRQPVNSAITVRNQVSTKQKLIQTLKNQQSVSELWTEVTFLVVLRFAVQLANLTCIWLFGWVWRTQTTKPNVSVQAEIRPVEGLQRNLAVADTPFDLLTEKTESLSPSVSAAKPNEGAEAPQGDSHSKSRPKQTSKQEAPANCNLPVHPQTDSYRPAEGSASSNGSTPFQTEGTPPLSEPGIPLEAVSMINLQENLLVSKSKGQGLLEVRRNSPPIAQNKQAPSKKFNKPPVSSGKTPELSLSGPHPRESEAKASQVKPDPTQRRCTQTNDLNRQTVPEGRVAQRAQPFTPPAGVSTPRSTPTQEPIATAKCQAPKGPGTLSSPDSSPKRAIPFPQRRPVESRDDDRYLEAHRRKIKTLVEQRNSGVSLSTFCSVLGERSQDIQDICNLKIPLPPDLEGSLESVLAKIQQLQQEEWAVGG